MSFETQVAVILAAAGSVCLLSLAVLLKLTGPRPRTTDEHVAVIFTLLGLGGYSIATSFFIVLFTLASAVWS